MLVARKQKGWSQMQAASALNVSQPYLSLLEKGERPITDKLARKAAKIYALPAALLPLETSPDEILPSREDELARTLAALGYPGFSHLKPRRKKNPAEVLAAALRASHLDSRLIEALPWVLVRFPDLDWQWLMKAAKLNDFQNRLGFVTNVARRVAEQQGETERAAGLAKQELLLERSRLAGEDTLCQDGLTQAEQRWLQNNRSEEARHWGLLTDLSPEQVSYAR